MGHDGQRAVHARQELPGELVELGGPKHAALHRAGQDQLLLAALARVVAEIDPVNADDRQGDVVADAGALPVESQSTDAVIVNGIFNLNPDKRSLLSEVFRVLRPGGRLVAAEIALRAPLPEGEGRTLDDWFR